MRVAYPIVCLHSGCLQRKLFALVISRRDLGEGPWAEPVQTDCFVDEVIKGINDNITDLTVFDLSQNCASSWYNLLPVCTACIN